MRYDTELRWATPAALVSASTPKLAATHDDHLRVTSSDTVSFTAAFVEIERRTVLSST